MSEVGDKQARTGIVQRVQDILFRPTATWDVIDGETATIGGLYRGYVIPLAAIPAVCAFIGATVFGWGFFGISFRPPILNAAVTSLVSFALNLAGVFVLALIIDALAPNFGGVRSRIQAFKVAAYSGTAAWLSGVFQLLPMLGILGVVGLYSLYLFFKGLPRLMKVPEGKAFGYAIVVILCAIIFWIIVGAITAPLMHMGSGYGSYGGSFGRHHRGQVSGTLNIPGVGSIDTEKVEKAAEKMRRAQETGEIDLVSTDQLKALLPSQAAGFTRGEVSSDSARAGAFGSARATADYSRDGTNVELAVMDISAAGPMAGLAGAFAVEHSREGGGAYEKVGRVNGRMTIEKYDNSARRGEYGVIVADRFMVQAQGDDVSMADLKSLVNSVDKGRLETLAK